MPFLASPRQRRVHAVIALAASAVGVAGTPAAAFAADPLAHPFTSVAFFGDSFLDAGNLYTLTRGYALGAFGFPPPPYDQGRFSSGPTWAEDFAALVGRPQDARPSLLGGMNYASGGATTGTVNVSFRDPRLTNAVDAVRAAAGAPSIDWAALAADGYGLQNQTLAFAGAHPADNAGTLAVLLGGGNDFINNLGPDPTATLTGAVTNMVGAATILYGAGVRSFLVPSLPDLSLTPRGRTLPPAQAAGLSALVGTYNRLLTSAFTEFAAGTGATYFGLGLDTLFENILGAPGAYGFTDTTSPCLFTVVPCAAAVFADDIHPSGRTHQVIAQAAYDRVVRGADVSPVPSPVPEPAPLALTVVGLGTLGAVAGARAARRRAA